MRGPLRERRAVFYAIRKRDGKYLSREEEGEPVEWSKDHPLAFRSRELAEDTIRRRLHAARYNLGLRIVRL